MPLVLNGFKTKLERERTKKMGLFFDITDKEDGSVFGLMSAGPQGCNGIPSGHPVSMLLELCCSPWLVSVAFVMADACSLWLLPCVYSVVSPAFLCAVSGNPL